MVYLCHFSLDLLYAPLLTPVVPANAIVLLLLDFVLLYRAQ